MPSETPPVWPLQEEGVTYWQATTELRVQRRYQYLSDQTGRYQYVVQQCWRSSEGITEWRDLPVVDENGNEADYD